MDLIERFKQLAAKTAVVETLPPAPTIVASPAASLDAADLPLLSRPGVRSASQGPQLATEWDLGTARLIAWLEGLAPPDGPLVLDARQTVKVPERFVERLKADIALGPAGPRARTGVLQALLQRFHEAVELGSGDD
jgi:hypothetical protein